MLTIQSLYEAKLLSYPRTDCTYSTDEEFDFLWIIWALCQLQWVTKSGSLSTVVGDEKLTSREDRIGPFFMYVQCDEDTLLKVDKVSKTEAQTFDVFDQLISRFEFCV